MPYVARRSSSPAFGKACMAGALIAIGSLQSRPALAIEEVERVRTCQRRP